jgi:peptide/nickel transport system permease protein
MTTTSPPILEPQPPSPGTPGAGRGEGPLGPLSSGKPQPKQKAKGELSQWQLIRIGFAKHKLAVVSLRVLILLYLIALFAEFVAPGVPATRDLTHAFCPPQLVRWNPTNGLHVLAMKRDVDPITFRKTYVEQKDQPIPLRFFARGAEFRLFGLIPMHHHLLGNEHSAIGDRPAAILPTFFFLGADKYGRDIFTRIVYGARISLSVGIIGIAFTFIFGMTIGGISGYIGGRTDLLIQRLIEIITSFPHLPLWIAIGAVLPQDWPPLKVHFAITVVLSLLGWTGLARVVRGKILSLREEDYAMAARLLGASHARVLGRHLLPGFTSHIIVALSLSVPGMILGETSLSFLGLGLRPPVVSWGVMLQDCFDTQALRFYPWLLAPVVFIISTVLCFNFVGDGLRDAADPYSTR